MMLAVVMGQYRLATRLQISILLPYTTYLVFLHKGDWISPNSVSSLFHLDGAKAAPESESRLDEVISFPIAPSLTLSLYPSLSHTHTHIDTHIYDYKYRSTTAPGCLFDYLLLDSKRKPICTATRWYRLVSAGCSAIVFCPITNL